MKIHSLDIDRFGLWSDLHLTKLEGGLNVFYGPNEAGKTTLMDFVRSILYGMQDSRLRYVRPLSWEKEGEKERKKSRRERAQMLYGGSLSLESPDGLFQIRRTFDPEDEHILSDHTLSITSADTLQREAAVLRMIVAGIDESTFNNVFTFGLDELRKLGTLGDTEAADMLFRLSIGLDRVSLVDVLKSLTVSRQKLLDTTGGSNGTIQQLLFQREKLTEELGESRVQVWEYTRLLTEQRKLDRVIHQLNEELSALRHEARINEIARNVLPIWDRRSVVREKIAEMGAVAVVPETALRELEEAQGSLDKRKGQLRDLKNQYTEARKKIAEVPVNENLWRLAPRIEIILEEEERIIELDQQITQLENNASAFEQELLEHEKHLRYGRRKTGNNTREAVALDYSSASAAGSAATYSAPQKAKPDSQTVKDLSGGTVARSAQASREGQKNPAAEPIRNLGEYRVYSKQVKRTKFRLARTKQLHEELLERSKVLSETMKTEMARRDNPDLHEALERTSEMVSHLRRRQGIAQRLEEMGQAHKDFDRQNAYLIQNQGVPSWVLVLLGGAAICTVVAIVMSFTNGLPPFFAGIGGIAVVAGFVGKIIIERSNSQKLEHNQRQLTLLLSQIDHAKQEAAAIDARFPAGGMSNELRFQSAQKELAALEKLIPVEAQRKETQHQLKEQEHRLARAKDAAQTALKRWEEWLSSASLPSDWTPQQIRDLIGRCDNAGEIRKNLDRVYDDINQRVRDLRIITDRIDRVVVETALVFADGLSYVDVLAQVRKQLTASEEGMKRRAKLTAEMKKLRPQRRKTLAAIQQARADRQEVLRKYGADSSEDLVRLVGRYRDHQKLTEQEASIQREINAALAGYCPEETIATQLEPDNRALLENRKEQTQRRIEATEAHLREETEKHGRLGLELQQLAQDQSALKKQRELSILNEKIRRSVHSWQVQAVSCRVMEDIRKAYERERQPQALAETSDYFRRLTAGRYQRVWTPLGEDTLKIDDAESNTFDVSLLSRGTREQLFISLRLALSASFARHGSDLPLVLDDVMVNFDTRRAQAAARVLSEFAEAGRQIILFTCHEHICRIFQRMDIPVRILPDFGDTKKGVRVLLPLSVLQKREAAQATRTTAEQIALERTFDETEDELEPQEE